MRESLLLSLRHPVTRCEPLSAFRTAPVPAANASYQDRLAEIRRQLTLDNYIWARDALESLLDSYPWQYEAAELYGWLTTRLTHLWTRQRYLRHLLWRSSRFQETDVTTLRSETADRVLAMQGHIEAYLHEMNITDATLLDVAMGQGDVSWRFGELAGVGRIVGLDASPAHLLAARKQLAHPKLSLLLALAENLPLIECADVVVLSAILEHCIDPYDLLAEAQRVAKRDALIVLQVPYGGFEWNTPDAQKRTWFDHVRNFDIAAYLEETRAPVLHFIDYSNDPDLPWSWYDMVGDFVGSFLNKN